MLIRRFAPEDTPEIAEIISVSPEAAAWSADALTQLASAGAQLWVAAHTGLVIGFLAGRCMDREYEILNLAVGLQHRRRGVAGELLQIALQDARELGCTQAYLEVRSSNQPALALYARYGFSECGRRLRYYRQPDEDALVLLLSLGGGRP